MSITMPSLTARLARITSPRFITNKLQQAATPQNIGMLGLTGLLVDAKIRMHAKAYRDEGFSAVDQQKLAVQEHVRQYVSTGLWLGSAAISFFVLSELFPRQSPFSKILASNMLSYIPDTFARPLLTAKITKHFWPELANKPQKAAAVLPETPPISPVSSGFAGQRFTPQTYSLYTPTGGLNGNFYANSLARANAGQSFQVYRYA